MKELSKHISTFAFFYAAIYCLVEGQAAIIRDELIWSFVCFVCAFICFLAVFRFQVQRLFNWLKAQNKI
jgi:hypothetical protein|tara:strand:- start:1033 stop:1239 length:207 start_codon:yes stop_codon:yes gene_type:complete